jgi:hypothetical protein
LILRSGRVLAGCRLKTLEQSSQVTLSYDSGRLCLFEPERAALRSFGPVFGLLLGPQWEHRDFDPDVSLVRARLQGEIVTQRLGRDPACDASLFVSLLRRCLVWGEAGNMVSFGRYPMLPAATRGHEEDEQVALRVEPIRKRGDLFDDGVLLGLCRRQSGE